MTTFTASDGTSQAPILAAIVAHEIAFGIEDHSSEQVAEQGKRARLPVDLA